MKCYNEVVSADFSTYISKVDCTTAHQCCRGFFSTRMSFSFLDTKIFGKNDGAWAKLDGGLTY